MTFDIVKQGITVYTVFWSQSKVNSEELLVAKMVAKGIGSQLVWSSSIILTITA